MAYSVTEAAGVEWVTPHIWHRKEQQVNAEQARAILAQGKKDGTSEAPIPEDDAKAISEANDLVEMAQTAWDQHVRGPEVEVLLKMAAAAEEAGDQTTSAETEPPADPPAEGASEETTEPEERAVEQTPAEAQPTAEGDDLSQVEPWERYDDEKVNDILAGINSAVDQYDDADLVELMANVWAYESAHKDRKTILNHLEEVARRLQSGEGPPETPAQSDDQEESGAQEGVEGRDGHSDPQEPSTEEGPSESSGGEAGEEVSAESGPNADTGELDSGGEESSDEAATESPAEPSTPAATETAPPAESSGDDAPVEEKPKRRRRQKKTEDESGDPDYDQLITKVEGDLERERVHKPPRPPEDANLDLPWDWTKMTNEELQRFHGLYSAIAYHKGYQLARDDRIALHCKAAADELHNALLVRAEKIDEHGKEKRVAVLEAEIEDDENIKMWRRRQRKHETFAASHRNERDSAGKIVEALSRHESMRHQEWERTTKLGQRRS